MNWKFYNPLSSKFGMICGLVLAFEVLVICSLVYLTFHHGSREEQNGLFMGVFFLLIAFFNVAQMCFPHSLLVKKKQREKLAQGKKMELFRTCNAFAAVEMAFAGIVLILFDAYNLWLVSIVVATIDILIIMLFVKYLRGCGYSLSDVDLFV